MSDNRSLSLLEELTPEIATDQLAPYLDSTSVNRLMQTSKHMYLLFREPYYFNKLIHCIFSADYRAASKLIGMQPKIIFKYGNTNYPNGDTRWKNGLTLACELLDAYMLEIFKKAILDMHDDALEKLFYTQILTTKTCVDLSPLFDIYPDMDIYWKEIASMQRKLVPYHMLKEFCRTGVSYDGLTQFYNLHNPPKNQYITVYDNHNKAFVKIYPFDNKEGASKELPIARNYRVGHAFIRQFQSYATQCQGAHLFKTIYNARMKYVKELKDEAQAILHPENQIIKKFKAGF